ncbi:hypothetical protein M9H77_23061 [Catharanthus roseus]|uniref:Uncharacterized protein n=1 Tax=Catharanthus roseus TaxID=4058 RepID=A0ACC0AUX9_CATRO|nr:hypothetical protein M9H77_23061 [Catharanthus roseus]
MRRTRRLGNLVFLDPEIERTFHARRRIIWKEKIHEEGMGDGARSLKDFTISDATGPSSRIVKPIIEANNFELKPSLLQMVLQNQFGGLPSEDPNCTFRYSLRSATLCYSKR